jgi:hypothetical protein
MMQNVEHHDARKTAIRERQPMGVGDDIDARKRKDVGGYDIGPGMLDVGGPAADIENAALRTAIEQPPVKIPVQEANRLFLFPLAAMKDLALVQIGRAPGHGKFAIKRL